VLAGTTASGKTEVSIPLAKMIGAEIINADSRQVYRELIIGTAPPSQEQLAAVPHHFVGTRSLSERWTAGDFAREARILIGQLLEDGKSALIVGGSMLYIRALLDGLYDSDIEPELDYPALKREWDERGGEAMLRELGEIDPESARRTHVNDHHRALRAIGIYRVTGERLSERFARASDPLSVPHRLYFLCGDRVETYARVNARAEQMIAAGLVDEVRALSDLGFNEHNCNPLRTHGYQEVFPYLRGECNQEKMLEAIQQAVRHYVKRQMTWFRKEPRATWVMRSFAEPPEIVARRIWNDFTGATPIEQNETAR